MESLRFLQAIGDQIEGVLRSLDPLLGFLLERMEDVDRAPELRSVDRSECVGVEVLNHLEDAGALVTLKGLRIQMLPPNWAWNSA